MAMNFDLAPDTHIGVLNYLLHKAHYDARMKRISSEKFPALPVSCNFLSTLFAHNGAMPPIHGDEKQHLKDKIIEFPADNYCKKYLEGLAKLFDIPCPHLYFDHSTNELNAHYFPKSSSIVISGNVEDPAVLQFIIAHEFAHGLSEGIYQLKDEKGKILEEIFCDAFARAVEVPGFPKNNQSATFAILGKQEFDRTNPIFYQGTLLEKTPAEIKTDRINQILAERIPNHPTFGERIIADIFPKSGITPAELEFAQAVGNIAYAKALVHHANSAVLNAPKNASLIIRN